MANNYKIIFFSLFSILFFTTLWVFFVYYRQDVLLKEKELRIKEETYVSMLLDQYNRDLQGCFTAVEKSKILTRNKCIESINNSRIGNLIKNWGYSELLSKQETATEK